MSSTVVAEVCNGHQLTHRPCSAGAGNSQLSVGSKAHGSSSESKGAAPDWERDAGAGRMADGEGWRLDGVGIDIGWLEARVDIERIDMG